MKKLSLDLDSLEVSSFCTLPERPANRGTVRGNDYTEWDCYTVGNEIKTFNIDCYETQINCEPQTQSQYYNCNPQPSQYDPSCGGTCDGATCGGQVCIPF